MRVSEVMSSPVVTVAPGTPSPYRVAVREGVVELTGAPDPTIRRLATLLVRGVPGVVDVGFAEE